MVGRWIHRVATLVVVSAAAASGCGSSASDSADESARVIERRASEWVDAARREDATALASLYAEDAALLPPGAGAVSGREAIRAMFADQFQRFDGSYEFETEEVVVRGDLAYRWGGYRVVVELPDGRSRRLDDRFIEIWRRGPDGVWRISRDIWNRTVPGGIEGD